MGDRILRVHINIDCDTGIPESFRYFHHENRLDVFDSGNVLLAHLVFHIRSYVGCRDPNRYRSAWIRPHHQKILQPATIRITWILCIICDPKSNRHHGIRKLHHRDRTLSRRHRICVFISHHPDRVSTADYCEMTSQI